MTQPAPTQTRHPWRATARTVVAGLVGLAAVLPQIDDTVHLSKTWPWFAGVLGVAAAITRILAAPAVEQWIRDNKLTGWLSAAPKPKP
jgi:hypothetical protein